MRSRKRREEQKRDQLDGEERMKAG
jgi:hypothetical protein